MLIQFRFKNYKSFKEENIFDMSATSQREHSDFLIEKNENKILPVVAFLVEMQMEKAILLMPFLQCSYVL